MDNRTVKKIDDEAKHIANTITDGFRRFFLGVHKAKEGGLTFDGEDDDPDLNGIPLLPPLLDEKPELKDLTDRNKALENKNAKLEGELSAYRQTLK